MPGSRCWYLPSMSVLYQQVESRQSILGVSLQETNRITSEDKTVSPANHNPTKTGYIRGS
jgi:hypothetical protein